MITTTCTHHILYDSPDDGIQDAHGQLYVRGQCLHCGHSETLPVAPLEGSNWSEQSDSSFLAQHGQDTRPSDSRTWYHEQTGNLLEKRNSVKRQTRQQRVAKALEMKEAGYNVRAVAEALGVKETTVYFYWREGEDE